MLVLVLAKPGPLCDSLVTLLKAMPQIDAVSQTSSASVALQVIESQRPVLVILDTTLLELEGWGVWRKLRDVRPQTRWVILVDDVQQQKQARADGAHVALLKGFPAFQLSATIESLLL